MHPKSKRVSISQLQIKLLEREIETLRGWSNKDCTAMADEALRTDEEYQGTKELLEILLKAFDEEFPENPA